MRNHKHVDLLSISDAEKAKAILMIRRQIQQKVMEEKLMRPLLKVEPSAITKELIKRKMIESIGQFFSEEAATWLTGKF
jgi:hypothetical protein